MKSSLLRKVFRSIATAFLCSSIAVTYSAIKTEARFLSQSELANLKKAEAPFPGVKIAGKTSDGATIYYVTEKTFISKDGNRHFRYLVHDSHDPNRFFVRENYAFTPWCRKGKVERDTRLQFDARFSANPSWFLTKSDEEDGTYIHNRVIVADSRASINLLKAVCATDAIVR